VSDQLTDKEVIFETIAGSIAYGTNDENSDVDTRGVAIKKDKSYYFGFLKKFEQQEDKNNDTVIYDIRKIFNLMADSNPSVLELLFMEERFWKKSTKHWEKIIEHKDKFLSKQARYSFCGYAMAQLKRIKVARNWLLNPPTKKPERSDFELPDKTIITKDNLNAFQWTLVYLIKDNIQYLNLSDSTKQELNGIEWIGPLQQHQLPEQSIDAMMEMTGASSSWMEVMKKEQAYSQAKRHWDSYLNWKENRNKKRAVLEEKCGYDCYVEETEFLTDNGWKKFDQVIENDLLATVILPENCPKHKEPFSIEYQKSIDKYNGTFTGNLYNLFGYHTDSLITPNHRMVARKVERESGKKYEWGFIEVANLPDTFEILRYPAPKIKNYTDKELFSGLVVKDVAFLRLMGWYLSDGCMLFKKGIPCEVRISQKKGGKLHKSMSNFSSKYGFKLYQYNRKPNAFNPNSIIEVILSVNDKSIVNKIFNDCGNKENKRIPRWVFKLSKYKMEILFDAMMRGDGTKSRPDNSMIYYSKSRDLASDIQELALLCGFETSLYGPYKHNNKGYDLEMYQVHINKTREQFKEVIRSCNIKTVSVVNKKIVCFTVPNGTLITRHNGHIGIHGNSKHASHLVRLLRAGKEVLETGNLQVYRPDRDELKAIKSGSWAYEQVEEYANKMEKEMAELYLTSKLPEKPDRVFLDNLCVEIIEDYLSAE